MRYFSMGNTEVNMKLCTRDESRHIDHVAMTEYGLPEQVLMESAGASIIKLMKPYISWYEKDVVVLCGTGNNGGDGFVAARYASQEGAFVTILLVGNEEHMGESSRMYRKAAETMAIPVIPVSDAEEAEKYIKNAEILIDALIGTGVMNAVTGVKAELIEMADESSACIISADVPSGMICDTGRAEGPVIDADYTIALGTLKRCHVLYPGTEYCGIVLYSDIGIPDKAREVLPVELVEGFDVAQKIPQRTMISHKGNNGFTGILAGSEGMAGAGLLAAQGALYGGAGKVALATLEVPAYELTGLVPEVMVSSMGDAESFNRDMVNKAMAKSDAWDVVAMGPGLGRSPDTQLFVKDMLTLLEKPVVVDADALFAIAETKINLRECPGELVLTPHVGEFARLTGRSPVYIEAHRIDVALEYAIKNQVVLVLKGAPTVTALPEGKAYVNSTGNPGMATGGMGDTLTGIIAALIGEGMTPGDAAVTGVYLHGLAGDRLGEKCPVGFTASELAREIPGARASLFEK